MSRETGVHLLERLRWRWLVNKLMTLALPAFGIGMLIAGLAWHFSDLYWLIGIGAFILIWGLGIFWSRLWQVENSQWTTHLDKTFPELEESTGLLLKPASELNLLERLQSERVLNQLSQLPPNRIAAVSWKKPVSWLLGLSLLGLLATRLPIPNVSIDNRRPSLRATAAAPQNEAIRIPQVKELRIIITPPAYTGKAVRQQTSPHLSVEAGAKVNWWIATNQPVQKVRVIFNGKKAVVPRLVQDTWTYQEIFTANAFYQIEIGDKLSEFYRIEVIPDKPPVVTVNTPQSYTEIAYGKPTDVRVNVNLKDDYGLTAAYLVATVAKGSGEAVKFREEKLFFGNSSNITGKAANLSRLLSLSNMDMAPGDELYFFVETLDNHAQRFRSDMFIVSLTDTAQATLAESMTMGVNPVPEYFRSQRQIIIDTEKLLKEQSRLSKEVFHQRSNSIGIDQKVLRLRYGKFLGEEFEDMIGEIAGKEELIGQGHHDGDGHDHSHDLHGLESFVHNHDESEEATFLEPAIKTKLKACLAEMWEAELRLRTYQPRAALPYEYKALKLLKEVQQSSRSYVAKTGFQLPPLKPAEKRLTGELDKIIEPVGQREWEEKGQFTAVRQAQPLLHKLREGRTLTAAEIASLEKAGNELSGEALRQPGRYLQALGDLRKLVEELKQPQIKVSFCPSCLTTVEKAFWTVLPPAPKTPAINQQATGKLGELYLEKL